MSTLIILIKFTTVSIYYFTGKLIYFLTSFGYNSYNRTCKQCLYCLYSQVHLKIYFNYLILLISIIHICHTHKHMQIKQYPQIKYNAIPNYKPFLLFAINITDSFVFTLTKLHF